MWSPSAKYCPAKAPQPEKQQSGPIIQPAPHFRPPARHAHFHDARLTDLSSHLHILAMFSNAPFANESSAPAARSSRRRPRPLSNEGSSLQPKAKRQRSEIVKQTFTPPDGAPEMEEAGRQMIPMIDRDASRDIQGARREIAVRGKMGKSSERASKGDGSILLVSSREPTSMLNDTRLLKCVHT